MKRPLCVVGIAFALAMWAAFSFDPKTADMLAVAALISGILVFFIGKKRRSAAMLALFAASAGFLLYARYYSINILPFEKMAGQSVTAEGIVTGFSRYSGAVQYILKADFPQDALPGASVVVRDYADLEFIEGDAIRVRLTLDAPDIAGVRDYYRSQGIWATGYASGEIEVLPADRHKVENILINLRRKLQSNLYTSLPPDAAGLVAAMVLGFNDSISPDVSRQLNRSGIVHLLSISGLHLSILCGFVTAVLERLRFTRRAAALATLAVAGIFTIMVGFSASITRAFVMTAFVMLARVVNRESDSYSALGAALILITMFWPHWTRGLGLWLSAGSTMGILLFGSRWADMLYSRFRAENRTYNRVIKAFLEPLAISAGAYILTFPILLLGSGWISAAAPLTNTLIAPFVPVVTLCGIFCAAIGGASLPVRVVAAFTALCAEIILKIAELLSRLPTAVFSIDMGYHLLWLAVTVVIIILLVFFKADKKLAGFGASAIILICTVGNLTAMAVDKDKIELISLEGCSASVLLRGDQAVILGAPSRYDIGKLSRYLDYRQVKNIRAIVAPDQGEQVDSGFIRLRDNYMIDCIISPDDSFVAGQLALTMKDIPVYYSGYAQVTVLDGAAITFDKLSSDMRIQIGDEIILKKDRNCAIIKEYGGDLIRIYRRGKVLVPKSLHVRFTPVGAKIFGETRLLLPV